MSDLLLLADLLLRHRECGPLAALNLTEKSVTVVAGAYEGTTMKFISDLYKCNVIGFEPQDVHRGRAEQLLRAGFNSKWSLFPYAIGTECGMFPMGEVGTDAASFMPDPAARTHGEGEMRNAVEVFQSLDLTTINLAVFNMEGYEYKLLPHLDNYGWLDRIEHLVIQFHDMAEMPRDYASTLHLLEKTHRLRWHYPCETSYAWTWQWWERVS